MTLMTTLGRLATRYAAARSRYLTQQSIDSLPAEIRKDIGWPDAHPALSRSTATTIAARQYL